MYLMEKKCEDCLYSGNYKACRECSNKELWVCKNGESDPSGIGRHDLGAKLDQGKLLAGILQQWPLALTAVIEVATFGAQKYTRGGWQHVPNGVERYTDAMFRHLLKEPVEDSDPDSGLAHDAHAAWNALARLELRLRDAL